jgi:hypothetical protein
MPLKGERKRAYQRAYMPGWEASHREQRKRSRHLSPARHGRFVSFDGEGFNRADGTHVYALLQDSAGGRIEDFDNGLSSYRCFRFILDAPHRFGSRFCGVSYGFDYDVNNFLRDLPRPKLERLRASGEVNTGRFRLEWRPRKWFQVSELDPVTNRTAKGRSVRIYDTLGFYNVAFIKACEDWVGADDPDYSLVLQGKEFRSRFKAEDAPFMRRYNEAELRLMIRLTAKLKGAFDMANIELFQYYGAGAAAWKFLSDIGFKRYINPEIPTEIRSAARCAYFGGRIEVPVYGCIDGPLHDYDINSAYPSAALDLPNIAAGAWSRERAYRPDLPFSLYHVHWNLPLRRPFYPFPWRAANGAIFFPPKGQAWLWSPELRSALEHGGFPKRSIRVLDAWHFTPDDPTHHPLAILREKYALRKRFEKDGNPAAKAIKLTLNAIYGKLAQSVSGMAQFGAREGKGRRPTFHQIEYAGFMASTCRARVFAAASQKPEAILAFATDGILSREPLVLPVSEEIGDWDLKTFEAATLVQSGVSRLQEADGSWETRGRGFAERDIPWADVLAAWSRGEQTLEIVGKDRFIGLGAVLMNDRFDLWRRFIPVPKELQLTAIGKRWDKHPPSRWTPGDNPATHPHETEPTDPFLMGLARGVENMESAPWTPKFEDPEARTAEEGEESVESLPLGLSSSRPHHSRLKRVLRLSGSRSGQ